MSQDKSNYRSSSLLLSGAAPRSEDRLETQAFADAILSHLGPEWTAAPYRLSKSVLFIFRLRLVYTPYPISWKIEEMPATTFERPFPPLTPAQRYHLDVYGYVIIENALSQDEVARLKDAACNLFEELASLEDRTANGPRVRGAFLGTDKPCHKFALNIWEADPAITAYATHPFMVSLAEELMGSEARIVEMNAHINSRDPDNSWEERLAGFHRGTDIPFAGHIQNGLFHCNFVKTLTNLTDLGPDDGGTAVIAGSHKIDVPPEDLIALAEEDRSRVHQMVAPAGSTLLFSETLIHATGPIRSDKERVIIITGYGSTMFPYWDFGELSTEFHERIPDQLRVLFDGKAFWTRALATATWPLLPTSTASAWANGTTGLWPTRKRNGTTNRRGIDEQTERDFGSNAREHHAQKHVELCDQNRCHRHVFEVLRPDHGAEPKLTGEAFGCHVTSWSAWE